MGDEPTEAAASRLPLAGAEEVSEARPGRQSPRNGWRAHARGNAKAEPSEHSSVEGALSREIRCPLTGRRRKRFWLDPKRGFGSAGFDDMGRQRVIRTPRSRLKTPRRWGVVRGSFDQRSPPGTRGARAKPRRKARFLVSESSEAGSATSIAFSLESCAGALVPSHVIRGAKAWQSTSRLGRSAGARVGNRLQKLVGRIFLAAREESREALSERGRGRVRR